MKIRYYFGFSFANQEEIDDFYFFGLYGIKPESK